MKENAAKTKKKLPDCAKNAGMTQEQYDATDMAMKKGLEIITDTLKTFGFEITEDQKMKLEMAYGMAFMFTIMSMKD